MGDCRQATRIEIQVTQGAGRQVRELRERGSRPLPTSKCYFVQFKSGPRPVILPCTECMPQGSQTGHDTETHDGPDGVHNRI